MPSRQPWSHASFRLFAWLRDHRRVGSESVAFVSSRLGTSFLVWLLVGIALALPAGLWILQVNMAQLSAGWEGRPGVSVYFDLGVSQARMQAVAAKVKHEALIDDVTVTSAEQALAEFKADAGAGTALSAALEELSENPLPASLRAKFVRGVETWQVEELTEQIAQLEGVAEVAVEKTWLERLNELTSAVTRLGLILGVMFGLGAVLVTSSSVRLAIENRLEELRVLKMVGATGGQIRRPFLYFGALYGFGGGVIAAMLIAVAIMIIEPPLSNLLGSYQKNLDLAGLDLRFLLFLLGIGSLLGVTGAIVAVRQRLRDLEIF